MEKIHRTSGNTCVVVLGMHRSGTSALSGALNLLGMDLGHDLMTPAEQNPKGFFENAQFTNLNDRIMARLDCAWDDPFPLPADWWRQDCLAEYQQQFVDLLETEFTTSRLIGFKDPRICVLLPWWQERLQKCQLMPAYPIIFRHPLEVAASLAKRNQFSVQKSVMLWMKHTLAAEQYTRHHPRCFTAFEQFLAHPLESLTRIISVLHPALPFSIEQRQQEILCFLKRDIMHPAPTFQEDEASCLSLVMDYYHLLEQLSAGSENDAPAIFERIERLRSQYEEWRSWFYHRELHVTMLIVNRQKEEIRRLGGYYCVQLFLDTGLGFNQTQSIIKPIRGHERIIEFDLTEYADICHLRFDPANAPAAIHLAAIELIGAEGERYPITIYQTNACHQNGPNYMFDTNDSMIWFASPAARLHKAVFTLEYVGLGSSASPYIEQVKNTAIQQHSQTIAQQAQALQERDQTITQQAQALQEREQTIQQQAQALQSKDSEISQKSLRTHRKDHTFSGNIAGLLQALSNLKLFAQPWSYHDASWKGKAMRFCAKKLWPQRLIRESGLFDPDYYLQNNPDVALAGGNPLQHFLRHGGCKGRNPNPLFDTAYYWERFPDVCQSQMHPLIHYVLYGRFEERWTNPFFDAAYYLKRYPDVQAAGIDPLLHYLVHGGVEGRKPSLEFDSAYYLETNPDVRQSGMNPLVHYLCYGAKEERFSSLTKTLDPYQRWMAQNEPTPADIEQQRRAAFPYQPTLSLITPVYQTPRPFLEAMLASVRQQTYPHWELCVADGGSAEPYIKEILTAAAQADPRIKARFLPENLGIAGNSNAAVALATGEWLVLLDHDDTLAPFALFEIVNACNAHPDADVIYSDEDKLDAQNRRCDPFFKPDWSPDTLRSYNYTIHCSAYRKTLFDEVGGFRTGFDGSQDYDLNLRITERARQIVHLPAILYHWRIHVLSTASNSAVKTYAYPAAQRALREHLQRIGLQGQVTDGLFPGSYHVMYQLPSSLPTISIIIPTHDHHEILALCLNSILEKSAYRHFEILLLENGSHDPATFALYARFREHPQIRVLTWQQQFNYAAINNWGAAHATGEVLLFLNNDVEVLTADWLERMLEHVLRPEIGAVSAKLYYPDDTVQHGGVILGLGGVAGHAHKGFPRSHPGYCRRLQIIQNVSAVTGACLMLRKEVFTEVGGFDEGYALAFNDVDLCLKIRAKNYLIIWTPYAELYHHESKTRGKEDTPKKQHRFQTEIRRFQQKWPAVLTQGDPYYNPNLTLDREDFSLNLRAPYPQSKHGRCANASNHKALSRTEKVLRHIHRHGQGIEIGPSYHPIAPKKDGYQVQIIDHLNCEQLRAKYRDQHVNIDQIEEVDFVWQGQSYVELTGHAKHYDWIIAAHVIEHTPDLIGFLLDCDSILKDDGVLSLVIPDKRDCFDHYRPLTGLAHVLDTHAQRQQMPTPGAISEHLLYAVANAGQIAWGQDHPACYACVHTVEQARQAMQAQLHSPTYHDVHVWCFVPHAFRLLVHDLFQLGVIPFQEVDFFPTEAGEFFVALGRQGRGLTSSRLELLEMIKTEICHERMFAHKTEE